MWLGAAAVRRLVLVHTHTDIADRPFEHRDTLGVRETMAVFGAVTWVFADVRDHVVVLTFDETHVLGAKLARSRIDRRSGKYRQNRSAGERQ